eukprot:TRINITY_DN6182_c0_g1_i18.p1 TRINITY_DN6182_c0_g1~~TRINITY_DN6182_c0_g1_i18.p1  ORF type:complete len:422 (+),score=130.81 TRINITY_DN6182_c0_g1_i18:114-1379(+)
MQAACAAALLVLLVAYASGDSPAGTLSAEQLEVEQAKEEAKDQEVAMAARREARASVEQMKRARDELLAESQEHLGRKAAEGKARIEGLVAQIRQRQIVGPAKSEFVDATRRADEAMEAESKSLMATARAREMDVLDRRDQLLVDEVHEWLRLAGDVRDGTVLAYKSAEAAYSQKVESAKQAMALDVARIHQQADERNRKIAESSQSKQQEIAARIRRGMADILRRKADMYAKPARSGVGSRALLALQTEAHQLLNPQAYSAEEMARHSREQQRQDQETATSLIRGIAQQGSVDRANLPPVGVPLQTAVNSESQFATLANFGSQRVSNLKIEEAEKVASMQNRLREDVQKFRVEANDAKVAAAEKKERTFERITAAWLTARRDARGQALRSFTKIDADQHEELMTATNEQQVMVRADDGHE